MSLQAIQLNSTWGQEVEKLNENFNYLKRLVDSGGGGGTGGGNVIIDNLNQLTPIQTYALRYLVTGHFEATVIQLPKDGKNIELNVDEGRNYLIWRYVGDDLWEDLYDLSILTGKTPKIGNITSIKIPASENPNFELSRTGDVDEDGNPIYEGVLMVPSGSDGKQGDKGNSVELRKTSTHVQWCEVGTTTWNNLIPLADLVGETGASIEMQAPSTHIQWRVQGTTTWNNLVALSELKGGKGDAPVKGVDYFDGKDPVLNIGTITTVASNAQANATIEPDGVDAEGKPKFKLNLWLPKGVDGEGAGDMLKSVYDQTGKNTDVFGYVDGKVKTDVPVNAKFTDTTYTEISEAEINTGTASTLRTITARRVTFILNKAQTLINSAISSLTKSSVGLGNVDNIQQASKTEFDTHNSDSTRHITSSERAEWNAKGSSNLDLGETSATAYRGDRGKIAYDHSQTAHAPSTAQKNSDITKAEIEAKLTGTITTHSHTVTKANVGLGSVDNTSDANKPVSTAQAAAIALKIDASKFQVVAELPASPATGVFYFIKE